MRKIISFVSMVFAGVMLIGTNVKAETIVSQIPVVDVFTEGILTTYADGVRSFTITKAQNLEFAKVNKKYIIKRTDYSDGLRDVDRNGIDDRDPYNACGYTDYNFNGIADGAPIDIGWGQTIIDNGGGDIQLLLSDYELCPHGVMRLDSIKCPICAEADRNALNYLATITIE